MNNSYTDSHTGISYILVDNYYIPNLKLPAEDDRELGKYGRMRLQYLQNNRKVTYINLLTSGHLGRHLHEVDEQAHKQVASITRQLAKAAGTDEALKQSNQMQWVGLMNNYMTCAEEIVSEWIFN